MEFLAIILLFISPMEKGLNFDENPNISVERKIDSINLKMDLILDEIRLIKLRNQELERIIYRFTEGEILYYEGPASFDPRSK